MSVPSIAKSHPSITTSKYKQGMHLNSSVYNQQMRDESVVVSISNRENWTVLPIVAFNADHR